MIQNAREQGLELTDRFIKRFGETHEQLPRLVEVVRAGKPLYLQGKSKKGICFKAFTQLLFPSRTTAQALVSTGLAATFFSAYSSEVKETIWDKFRLLTDKKKKNKFTLQ